jgi:hypothetical protein
MARSMPPFAAKKQLSFMWLACVFAFFGQLSLSLAWSVDFGIVAYLIATGSFLWSLRSNDVERDLHPVSYSPDLDDLLPGGKRMETLWLIALIGLAAFFRLYSLNSQPWSLWLDESLTGLNALEIIEGKTAPIWGMTPLDPWRPEWVKTSVFKIFGIRYFGLKMISVLPAVASIAVAYYLFKELASMPIALVAAFLMAVSQWHHSLRRCSSEALL